MDDILLRRMFMGEMLWLFVVDVLAGKVKLK